MLWGGILNLSTRLGASSKLSFNNTYNRSADNEATELAGFNEEFNVDLDVTRLTFTERTVRSHQLDGRAPAGPVAIWSTGRSRAPHVRPVRAGPVRHRLHHRHRSGDRRLRPRSTWLGGPRSATRTFSDLDETRLRRPRATTGCCSAPAQPADGGQGRRRCTARWTETRTAGRSTSPIAAWAKRTGSGRRRRSSPGPAAEDSRLSLFINANGGRYDAEDRLAAGYAQVELPLGGRLRLIGGARIEQWDLDLNTLSPQGHASATTREQHRHPPVARAQLPADGGPGRAPLRQPDALPSRIPRDRERQLVRADRRHSSPSATPISSAR